MRSTLKARLLANRNAQQQQRRIKMLGPLDGYKTYIIVAVFLVLVALEKGLGWDVPGFDVGNDWLTVVLGALGLGALRNGMPKK